jgi:hypothetical protein
VPLDRGRTTAATHAKKAVLIVFGFFTVLMSVLPGASPPADHIDVSLLAETWNPFARLEHVAS